MPEMSILKVIDRSVMNDSMNLCLDEIWGNNKMQNMDDLDTDELRKEMLAQSNNPMSNDKISHFCDTEISK